MVANPHGRRIPIGRQARRFFVLPLLILVFAALTLQAQAPADLTISAAASLKDVLDQIASAFKEEQPRIALHFNLGASGSLQQQIEQGAPVDVFLSASPSQMDALASEGLLLQGTRRDLLRNSIVLITPAGDKTITGFPDLARPQVRFIAIGEPQTVPAGAYAKEVLARLHLYEALQPKFVFARDVRQVLTYVATGNADAGIVYKTDAITTSQVRIVAVAPDDLHSPVIYPVAILRASHNTAAAKVFCAFLSSSKAQQIFQKYGFSPVR